MLSLFTGFYLFNRPLEMSSKQRPSKFRKVVAGGSKVCKSPLMAYHMLKGTGSPEVQ